MKLSTILLFASCLVVCAETEERLTKRFAVQPGGNLLVEVDFGSIDVKSSDSSEVVVEVVRKITRSTKAGEEAFLASRPVTMEAEGNSVKIESRPQAKENAGSRGKQRTDCRYTISVPAKINAQIKTGAGAVAVSGLTGEVKARSSGGGLTFAQLHGPLEASTGAGAIRVTECEGEQQLKTAGGGIEVFGGAGSLAGNTGGGLVSVKDFKGGVQVKSAGGGMTLENVVGRVEGKTGGGAITARFAAALSDEVNLTTAGGGVTLQVPATAAFDLDAVTAGGNVSSELSVDAGDQGKKPARNRLSGPVNGGGKPVVLRSGGGAIQVKKS